MTEYLTHNLGKKILAITLAVILWIIANFEQDIEKNIELDIQYNNLPADLIIKNNPPEALSLRIRGSRTKLSILNTDNYSYPLSLNNVITGISKFNIRTEQIAIPGIQVIGISPSEIKIDVDKVAEKKIGIKPKIGLPDIGFKLVGDPKVVPSSVRISGPKSVLEELQYINTDEIKVAGEKTNFTIEVPLKTNNPLLMVMDDNEVVKITVNLEETMIEKEFKDLKINLTDTDNIDYEVVGRQTVDLLFKGPYSTIKDLSSDIISIDASLNDINKNVKKKQKLKLTIDYPNKEEIKLEKITPGSIEVLIK